METCKILRPTLRQLACGVTVAAAFGAASPAHALTFNLTSTGNATADMGFQAAASFWQGVFIDPVIVNITAGFALLDPNVLGQAGSAYLNTSFAAMKTALGVDASSVDDATMVVGLPGGSNYSKLINGTADSGGATHVHSAITDLQVTRANAKAIGLVAANDAAEDAQITFSSAFNFDFDPSDGIGAGLFDFVGIAIHELGHAMGFTSGVDFLDTNSNGPGVSGSFRDAYFDPYATLLDFTRCSGASQQAGADIDWTIGGSAKDFAIDGACSALVSNAWSTGKAFGDGWQASHWKDSFNIGIMDPTAVPPSQLNVVTARDIQAFDVIGWTQSVPEPASFLLFRTALLGMGVARKLKRPGAN